MAGRSRQLALAVDTDLPKLVLCQVSPSLLEYCPLSPFHRTFLCLKIYSFGGCLACGVEWQHHGHCGGITA